MAKSRQIENLEEKAWAMQEYKDDMSRQLDQVIKHTFAVTENCSERVASV